MTPVNDDMANAVSGYKSPIELYMNEIKTKVEGDCVKAIQEYGFKVDKYELAKALKYDRDQYNSGYLDGHTEARQKFERPQGEWITWEEAGNDIASPNRHECSCCHDSAQVLVNGIELLSDFCPNCGADMRKEAQHDSNKQRPTH